MSTRILFTHSYFYRFDPKQWKAKQPYPPYGTLYAAAVLRECGFEVALFDTNLKKSPTEILPILGQINPKYLVIYDDGFNYLTKMCLTRMREAAFQLIKLGKSQGCTVIVSSSDSTDQYETYLAQGADFVLLGEGEITLRELVQTLEAGIADCAGIPGLAYALSSDLVRPLASPGASSALAPAYFRTAPRPVVHVLDDLPDPAWDLVEMADYQQIWRKYHGYFSLNIATTRGCPYKCNWCAKPIYGNRYHSRSPERVATEIEQLIHRYGVRHIWMADDIFGLKPGWISRFRAVVQEKKLKFRYKIQSRVDLLLKEESIADLVVSGLQQVWVGAESGSQKILDAMDKGTTVEEIRLATQLLKKNGVEVCFFLQFGYLSETKEDVEATLRLVEELLPHDIGISVSYPLPGTKFYDKVKDLLGEKKHWAVSDDLAMMYPATFSAAYYRRLHRLAHKRFRLQQGKMQARQRWKMEIAVIRRLVLILYYGPATWIDTWRLKRLERQ